MDLLITFADMARPLPTNVELLIFIANEAKFSYELAYSTWCSYYRHPDAHLIVETIFHIARSRQLPIGLARMAFEGNLSNYTPHN